MSWRDVSRYFSIRPTRLVEPGEFRSESGSYALRFLPIDRERLYRSRGTSHRFLSNPPRCGHWNPKTAKFDIGGGAPNRRCTRVNWYQRRRKLHRCTLASFFVSPLSVRTSLQIDRPKAPSKRPIEQFLRRSPRRSQARQCSNHRTASIRNAIRRDTKVISTWLPF